MAFTSYGNRVYASIRDLPQYTSINNGDKIIVWNESREGAATIDYSDFIIDLEHTSFGTTINELLTFTSAVESFISTAAIDIENLDNKIKALEETNEKFKGRIETLEYMLGVVYGITVGETAEKAFIPSDEGKTHYNNLCNKMVNAISDSSATKTALVNQAKFAYNASPVGGASATAATPLSTNDIVDTYTALKPEITTYTLTEKNGEIVETPTQKTTITYS